ncbi:hypothetical protein Peur_018199 [Populus x canadensis]
MFRKDEFDGHNIARDWKAWSVICPLNCLVRLVSLVGGLVLFMTLYRDLELFQHAIVIHSWKATRFVQILTRFCSGIISIRANILASSSPRRSGVERSQ